MLRFTLYKSFSDNYKEIKSKEESKKKLEHQSEFIDLWDKYTQDLFQGLDWMGYIVAGEFICKCISNTVTDEAEIDLYVYGENIEERAENILKLLGNFEERAVEFSINKSVIKILGLKRIIKIHCTNKKNPSEIIKSFDFSHLQIYYDGNDFKSTEEAFWSINKLKTIIVNDTSIKAINDARSVGFDILYKEGQKFRDEYGIKHDISIYKNISQIDMINKNSKKTTKSKAMALNYVVLDGHAFDHEITELNLDWKLLNLNYLRLEKSEKKQTSYITLYNNKKLILRTPLIMIHMIKKLKLGRRTHKFALIDYFDNKFEGLIGNIMQMKHKLTTYYPHPDFDPIRNLKISKKLKTKWPNYFYALISIKCYNDSGVHPGKYWILTIKDIWNEKSDSFQHNKTINQSSDNYSLICEGMDWEKLDKQNEDQQRSFDDEKKTDETNDITMEALCGKNDAASIEELCRVEEKGKI